jgi:hypothetical protein
MPAMIELRGISGSYLLPVPIASTIRPEIISGARAAVRPLRGAESRPFDHEIARRRDQNNLQVAERDGQTKPGTALIAADPEASSPARLPARDTVPYLTQQIAQEMSANDSTATRQFAAEAIGLYRAIPDSRVFIDGPQVAFDITV